MTVFQVTEKQKIQYLGSPKEVNPPGRGPATPNRRGRRGAHPKTAAGEAAAVSRPFDQARSSRGGEKGPYARRRPKAGREA